MRDAPMISAGAVLLGIVGILAVLAILAAGDAIFSYLERRRQQNVRREISFRVPPRHAQ